MLLLQIPDQELWDPIREKFITVKGCDVELEHCMCLTKGVDPNVFNYLTQENTKQISDYIGDSSTATWFSDSANKRGGKREIITAEIIYYWMTAYNIPESYQFWHINKLMTLLRVCAEKNNPDKNKKLPKANMAAQRRALNAARRHTRG